MLSGYEPHMALGHMEQHTLAESRGGEVTCTLGGVAVTAGMGGTLGGGAWP